MKRLRYITIVAVSLIFLISFSGAVLAEEWTAEDLANNITDFGMEPEGSIEDDVDDVDFYYRRTQEEPELYLEFGIDYQDGELGDVTTALRNYLKVWDAGNNIIVIDSIDEVDTQRIQVDVTSMVEDDRLETFDQYDVMVVDEDSGVEEKIFDFEKRPPIVWSEERLYENITRVDMGPRESVSPQEGNLFHYRSTGDGIYMLIDIDYESHELEAVKEALYRYLDLWLGDDNEGFDISEDDDNIEERFAGQIEVEFSGIADDFNMQDEYDITMTGDRNRVLASVIRMPLHLPPDIRGELEDYPELGELRPNRLYYLKDTVGNFIPRITAADDYFLSYRIGGLTTVRNELIDGAISFDQFDPHDRGNWLFEGYHGSINEGFNLDYINAHDDVDQDDEFIIDPDIYDEQNADVADGFHGVRIKVDAYGVAEPQYANFYFVRDNSPPAIQAGILDADGRFSGNYGEEFGTALVPKPQLRIKILDELSGIESRDDIEVKYLNLDDREPEEITYDDFDSGDDFDGFMDVINLEDRLETRPDGEQIATVVPFSDMEEGEYMVKVKAEDKAGNSSLDLLAGDETEYFIFYLEIDASQPEIYNLRLNHPSQIEEITGTDALDLRFDVVGVEDLVYGINYLDDNSEGWVVAGERDLGLIRRRNKGIDFSDGDYYFIDDDGLAKDGEYEIRIIGDEEEIGQLNELEMNELDLDALWEEEVREGRRDYEEFRFRVDGRPPGFNHQNIRYITGAGDSVEPEEGDDNYNYTISPPEADLVNEGSGSATNFGVLYTDMPTFEIQFENLSEVRADDVEVRIGPSDNERLARVVGLEEDDSGELNQYTLEIQPRRGLDDANHNLIIEVEDIHGNSSEIRYDNLFESSHIDGRIDFNVPEGRSTINEGSAFEIYLPDDLDTDTLSVAVDDTPIVSSGNIVGEGDAETRDDEYYEVEEYYTDDDYESAGFDVIFFENKRRILVFIRMPITGKVEVDVEVENRYGDITTDNASFRVDNYRDGFGFGRLLIIDED